jgi:hypothetical protein
MSPDIPTPASPPDQMPEEAPAEQVHDDVSEAPEGAAREAARRYTKDARRHRSERDGAGEEAAGDDGHGGGAR